MVKEELEIVKMIAKMPSVSFKNKHGEKFTLHSNGIFVFMSGDEVNAMVSKPKIGDKYIPLFNDKFNIWSSDELGKLGDALQKLSDRFKND